MWCFKITEVYNCNLRYINRFRAPQLGKNDIEHFTIVLLIENHFFIKMSAGGHFGFSRIPTSDSKGILTNIPDYFKDINAIFNLH